MEVSAIGGPAHPSETNRAQASAATRLLLDATAQGLVRFDAAGQIEAGLAERWIVMDGGRSFIFRLRDAQWPDGTPVTADEVVRLLKRATAPRARSPLAPFLAVIDEMVAMTPQVIEIRLKRPRPDLLNLFAQPELALWNARHAGGGGPFRIQSADADGAVLRPIPDFDATADDLPAAPRPRDYVRLRGERAALALARFAARRSDLVTGGSFADWPLVDRAAIAPLNRRVETPYGLFGLSIVRRQGFLADPANRAALAMTIDRAALTGVVLADWAPAEALLPAQLDSAIPPAAPAWSTLDAGQRRAAAVRQVASWRAAHGGAMPTVRVALPAGPGATLLWGRIARDLIDTGVVPQRVAFDAPADLRLVDQVAPYDSGRWYLVTACQPCGSGAYLRILAARDAATLEERSQRIAQADAALAADTAFIPLARPLRWSAVAQRLTGWQGNPRGWHPLNRLRTATR